MLKEREAAMPISSLIVKNYILSLKHTEKL